MNVTARVSLVVLAMCSLAACSTTIVDTAPTTTLVPPTTVVPSGTATELFDQLQITIGELSKAISDNDRAMAKVKLAEVEEIWKVLKPQIAERGDQFIQDMQRIIDLAISSIERNRPADADKSLRFLSLVIETL
jgi:DNA-directed RNA polymerase subunit H (RpoH/RPB5)